MIGLSVSNCVREIAEGRVPLEAVEKIVGRTNFGPEDIGEVIETYSQSEWSGDPATCERIFRELYAAGKIEQPRREGKPYPNIRGGQRLWVEREDEIEYHQPDRLVVMVIPRTGRPPRKPNRRDVN